MTYDSVVTLTLSLSLFWSNVTFTLESFRSSLADHGKFERDWIQDSWKLMNTLADFKIAKQFKKLIRF